jgi:hypothetical protein
MRLSGSIMEKRESKFLFWLQRIRTIAAWLVIPAFISMFVAHQHLINTYPMPSIPMPKSRGEELSIVWRNYSLMSVIGLSLFSLPRWQSIAGIIGIFIFLILFGRQ